MSLAAQITDYVNAAFSGLWLQTQEPDEAEREIARLAHERHWRLAAWDVAAGLRFPAEPASTPSAYSAASSSSPEKSLWSWTSLIAPDNSSI